MSCLSLLFLCCAKGGIFWQYVFYDVFRQMHESLPVYGGSIREIQNRLQRLHTEVAEYSKALSQDKRYSHDRGSREVH